MGFLRVAVLAAFALVLAWGLNNRETTRAMPAEAGGATAWGNFLQRAGEEACVTVAHVRRATTRLDWRAKAAEVDAERADATARLDVTASTDPEAPPRSVHFDAAGCLLP